MVKHAILIQCHSNPELVNSLISFASADSFDFFIHVDKKSSIQKEIVKKSNVYFVGDSERVNVRWGSYSQVEATLELLKIATKRDYLYVHLISGVDFFAMHPSRIIEALDGKKEYISCNKLPINTWSFGGYNRICVRYPSWMIRKPKSNPIIRFIRILYQFFVMKTRVFKKRTKGIVFYGGSSWWSVTGNLAKWMVKYIDQNQNYVDIYRNGILVDEVFFSTLAMMSPFSANISNSNLRFIDWTNSKATGGPRSLGLDDVSTIAKSGMLFARKIEHIEIIENIKNKLISGENNESVAKSL